MKPKTVKIRYFIVGWLLIAYTIPIILYSRFEYDKVLANYQTAILEGKWKNVDFVRYETNADGNTTVPGFWLMEGGYVTGALISFLGGLSLLRRKRG